MWEKLSRIGLVVFLSFVVYCVAYNAKMTPGRQPSGDMYLTAEQWERVSYHIDQCEKKLEENGIGIPGSRVSEHSGRPERPNSPGR